MRHSTAMQDPEQVVNDCHRQLKDALVDKLDLPYVAADWKVVVREGKPHIIYEHGALSAGPYTSCQAAVRWAAMNLTPVEADQADQGNEANAAAPNHDKQHHDQDHTQPLSDGSDKDALTAAAGASREDKVADVVVAPKMSAQDSLGQRQTPVPKAASTADPSTSKKGANQQDEGVRVYMDGQHTVKALWLNGRLLLSSRAYSSKPAKFLICNDKYVPKDADKVVAFSEYEQTATPGRNTKKYKSQVLLGQDLQLGSKVVKAGCRLQEAFDVAAEVLWGDEPEEHAPGQKRKQPVSSKATAPIRKATKEYPDNWLQDVPTEKLRPCPVAHPLSWWAKQFDELMKQGAGGIAGAVAMDNSKLSVAACKMLHKLQMKARQTSSDDKVPYVMINANTCTDDAVLATRPLLKEVVNFLVCKLEELYADLQRLGCNIDALKPCLGVTCRPRNPEDPKYTKSPPCMYYYLGAATLRSFNEVVDNLAALKVGNEETKDEEMDDEEEEEAGDSSSEGHASKRHRRAAALAATRRLQKSVAAMSYSESEDEDAEDSDMLDNGLASKMSDEVAFDGNKDCRAGQKQDDSHQGSDKHANISANLRRLAKLQQEAQRQKKAQQQQQQEELQQQKKAHQTYSQEHQVEQRQRQVGSAPQPSSQDRMASTGVGDKGDSDGMPPSRQDMDHQGTAKDVAKTDAGSAAKQQQRATHEAGKPANMPQHQAPKAATGAEPAQRQARPVNMVDAVPLASVDDDNSLQASFRHVLTLLQSQGDRVGQARLVLLRRRCDDDQQQRGRWMHLYNNWCDEVQLADLLQEPPEIALQRLVGKLPELPQ